MRIVIMPICLGLMACVPVAQDETVPNVLEAGEPAGARPPPASARTVEQFDTTSEEERVAAAAPASGGSSLGETVATLGDAAMPGFWVATPLVDAVSQGWVVNDANDKSVEVELRPLDGGSSRISLAALRVLEVPLTGLVTLAVYQR